VPLLTDLNEVKLLLGIDAANGAEDGFLNFLIEIASAWILEFLDRPGFFRAARTEFYRGTGTQQLLLKSRPVLTTPTIEVYVSTTGYWGTSSGAFGSNTQLTYGSEFTLEIDQDDGSSRSGILWRIGDYWPRPFVRARGLLAPFVGDDLGSVKVVYTGGYTVDNMPAQLRSAAHLLIAKLRVIYPTGMELRAESYEERAVSYDAGSLSKQKNYLLSLVAPMLTSFRNWRF